MWLGLWAGAVLGARVGIRLFRATQPVLHLSGNLVRLLSDDGGGFAFQQGLTLCF